MPHQPLNDRHGDASLGAPEGCMWGLIMMLIFAAITLIVLKVLGVF